MSKSIYIVYETTNLINGMYYIGVHKLNGRNYLGSGVVLIKAIKKYGRENFIRETLEKFDKPEDAYNFERIIVTKELVKNRNCYNISEGGNCGFVGIGIDNPFYGRHHSDEAKKKNRNAHLGKGHPHSNETKVKISNTKKGNTYNSKVWFINGRRFSSSREAGKYYNVHQSTICNWCNSVKKTDCYSV